MRIFVAEYVSGGGLVSTPLNEIPASLRREGCAMIRALIQDMARVADVVTPIDWRLTEMFDDDSVDIRPISQVTGIWHQWIAAASMCEKAIIVAPETDGTLAKGVAMLRAAGIDVVACSGEFLRVASDKWLTAKTLLGAGVAHPVSITTHDQYYFNKMPTFERYVVKPRDGCGTHRIRLYESLAVARSEMASDEICQPMMPGRPISIALIANETQFCFLPAVNQHLDLESCEYEGGSGPLDDDGQRRACSLAARAVAAMPPMMRGYVGFDLLLGDTPSGDTVIEINPRLSTSYVGLRKIVGTNLAAHMIGVATDPIQSIVPVDSVRWTADGVVSTSNDLHAFTA
jgi:tyramine---L-glutamate ligase